MPFIVPMAPHRPISDSPTLPFSYGSLTAHLPFSYSPILLWLPNGPSPILLLSHSPILPFSPSPPHFCSVVCGFVRGGAFFTYLSNQLIISYRTCSIDSRPLYPCASNGNITKRTVAPFPRNAWYIRS